MKIGGDLKDQQAIIHSGSSNSCLYCTNTLKDKNHCKWRPACLSCKAFNSELVFCRHFPDLDKIRPYLGFERLIIPKKEEDFKVKELIVFATSLGVRTLDGTKKRKQDDIWNDCDVMMKRDLVVLATHMQTTAMNIVNAPEVKIM